MILKLLLLLNLVGYAFVVCQPFFYLLAMSNAQKNLQAPAYVELRNLLDSNLMVYNRIVYYAVLLSSAATVAAAAFQPQIILLVTSIVACVALWIDLYLMFKGNLPINKAIQDWRPDKYPANWQEYRTEWFMYYHRRQWAAIAGFVSVVVGVVFQ